ncbi:MAG: hypothetical protein CL840_01005 [Crocinitomicaceae bacterium]|nr:hypothetical protein [Crocinitomicaceae bacterium]|tara:strand:- start:2304 stop:2738 length:435 start_codon:yes stop_codon:yes gene_type:complete
MNAAQFNRKAPSFPESGIEFVIEKTFDMYDGLTTMGIVRAPDDQLYFRYWTGESREEGWISFAIVPVVEEQVDAIANGKVDIREFLLTNKSHIITYATSSNGQYIETDRSKMHIERYRQLVDGEVPMYPYFIGMDDEDDTEEEG